MRNTGGTVLPQAHRGSTAKPTKVLAVAVLKYLITVCLQLFTFHDSASLPTAMRRSSATAKEQAGSSQPMPNGTGSSNGGKISDRNFAKPRVGASLKSELIRVDASFISTQVKP